MCFQTELTLLTVLLTQLLQRSFTLRGSLWLITCQKEIKRIFVPTKSGAGMTKSWCCKSYRAKNPGSKLKTAVTGKVKKGSKDAKRRNLIALGLRDK